jgi:hypothetical protein
MIKFFTVDLKPDIVNGDISNIQNANKSHLDVGAGELIFDWTEVEVPKGGCMLRSITAIVNGEDGAVANSLTNYQLIFAKSVNGEAPTSMGAVNAAQTGCFDLGDHHVGSAILESTAATGTLTNPAFHVVYHANDNSATGGGLPLVIDLDAGAGGFNKLYVCAFQMAARHYATGVIVNGAITSDTEDTITVDGVDAVKIFSVGDTVYLHDVDTALGTVKSVSTNSVVLNAAIAGGTDLADDDELVNANPIKIKLGFER